MGKKTPAAQAWLIRTTACDDLIRRLADVANHFPARMDLQSHPATAALAATPSPASKAPYKQREDLLDAAICAWTAALWHQFGNERCQVLGVSDDVAPARPIASIIAPARPEQRPPQAAAA